MYDQLVTQRNLALTTNKRFKQAPKKNIGHKCYNNMDTTVEWFVKGKAPTNDHLCATRGLLSKVGPKGSNSRQIAWHWFFSFFSDHLYTVYVKGKIHLHHIIELLMGSYSKEVSKAIATRMVRWIDSIHIEYESSKLSKFLLSLNMLVA